jgi:hypothetical protein
MSFGPVLALCRVPSWYDKGVESIIPRSESMTISLTFPPETEARLRQRAVQEGQTVEVYVQHLVEQVLTPCTPGVVLAALAAAPSVPADWVDELEGLIAQGERSATREDPFAEGT